MRGVKQDKINRALRDNGLVRQKKRGKGSHTRWLHPDDPTRKTTVPDHPDIDIKTVNSILTGAGKDRRRYRDIFRGREQ